MQKIAIGSDHRGGGLKEKLKQSLNANFAYVDVGTNSTDPVDYPDIASLVAKRVLSGECVRGIIICGSGVGACVAANKFKGIRAGICHDVFSAHQGVEDDDMNVLCIGGGVIGESLAAEIIAAFLSAEFKPEERFLRRLEKVKKIEDGN